MSSICAPQAIAAHESRRSAPSPTLDHRRAARRAAEAPASRRCRCAGLPVGIKDIFDTADMPTAYGSPIYAGHQPSTDAAMVMLIRRAGGVILGKTVTTEFAVTRAGRDPQPAQSRAHAGRLVVRLGRRRRRGHAAARARQPDRRLDDPPRRLLRRRRLQAVLQAVADRRHEMLLLVARHRRAVRGERRRRRLRRRRDQRPRPAGRRPARRRRRRSRSCAPHAWDEASDGDAGRGRAAPRAPPSAPARRSRTWCCPRSSPTRRAPIDHLRATRPIARSPTNTTTIATGSGPLLRAQLDEAAAITPDAYDDARRTARARARRSSI